MVEFEAYERSNGEIGIRNHVLIISPVVYTNKLAENIHNQVKDTVPIYSQYGRNLKGNDEKLHNNTLIGIGKNPNVSSVLVLGWEGKQMDEIAKGIAESKKLVEKLQYIDTGLADATAEGVKKSIGLLKKSYAEETITASIKDLRIGIECGGSDATSGVVSNPVTGDVTDEIVRHGGTAIFSESVEILGAEDILANRATTEEVKDKIYDIVNRIEDWSEKTGYDINERNPVEDNVEGGITTIEEKSLGAISKSGTKEIQDVLYYGEKPTNSGLFFMDTPAAAQQSMAGKIAAGANLIVFSTGRANPAGTPIAPVIKVTGNPSTVKKMSEHIDVDISKLFQDRMGKSDAKDQLLEELVTVADGKRVSSELLSHGDFAPKRDGDWILS